MIEQVTFLHEEDDINMDSSKDCYTDEYHKNSVLVQDKLPPNASMQPINKKDRIAIP